MRSASIQSLQEYEQVKKVTKASSSYWLSGTNLHRDGEWIWANSLKAIAMKGRNSLWGENQPNNIEGIEQCAMWLGEIHDYSCDRTSSILCEY